MASAVIHLAVAKKVNEILKQEEKAYYLGTIAPDIAKMVGSKRHISHFCDEIESTPNIKIFLDKYEEYLSNPFEMGYYVHLLTDKLWFDEFLKNFREDNYLVNIYGEKVYATEEQIDDIIYNDYTNLNEQIVSYYNLDYSLFYEKFEHPVSHIKELPNEYFEQLLIKFSELTTITTEHNYILKLEPVTHFIEYATQYCLDNIRGLKHE